jgi:hypothetical protein
LSSPLSLELILDVDVGEVEVDCRCLGAVVTLLGSTSNVVERGNRRYRKIQKTVYRLRTRRGIEGRLALDLQRGRRGDGRAKTTHTLHEPRAA